jgi:hypothetical protein
MRALLILAGFLASALTAMPAMAQTFDTTTALLQYIYDGYGQERYVEADSPLYSKGMKALLAADAARTPEDEVGALDFDPFTNSQDPQPQSIRIGEPVEANGQVLQDVTFDNGGGDVTLNFTLVKEADGWKIDDVAMKGEDDLEGWRLSDILTADPLLN